MTDRLAGKVTVVTGAGSGLGRAAALRFAAEGARVGCADIDLDKAEAAAAEIAASGGQAPPRRGPVPGPADARPRAAGS
jgi:NAD(P)-dependent dehydrogenase (short-subunit alcohol dehydrogenase family)